MRLVRLPTPDDGHTWVNPEHVSEVKSDKEDRLEVRLFLQNGREVTVQLGERELPGMTDLVNLLTEETTQ